MHIPVHCLNSAVTLNWALDFLILFLSSSADPPGTTASNSSNESVPQLGLLAGSYCTVSAGFQFYAPCLQCITEELCFYTLGLFPAMSTVPTYSLMGLMGFSIVTKPHSLASSGGRGRGLLRPPVSPAAVAVGPSSTLTLTQGQGDQLLPLCQGHTQCPRPPIDEDFHSKER